MNVYVLSYTGVDEGSAPLVVSRQSLALALLKVDYAGIKNLTKARKMQTMDE